MNGRWRPILSVLFGSLLLISCTNSKLVIGPLYNRLDDQMRSEFNKLGDFNADQKANFDQRLGTFHVWHRQNELPQYAALLREISTAIDGPGQTSQADITRWLTVVETHSQAARQCHPVNFSFELMKTLTDEQVNFIEQRFIRERQKNRKKYESRSAEERVDYRLKNISKWSGRIGLDLSANQRAMLRTALTQQISLRKQYYALSDQWNKELFMIARDQDNPQFDKRMTSHLQNLWALLENAYPEQWASNQTLWQDFAYRFINSFDAEQREHLGDWLARMSDTLSAISRDEPSFQTSNDPLLGCVVESAATIEIDDKAGDQTG